MSAADEIKKRISLVDHIASRGIKVIGQGVQRSANVCAAKEHSKGHDCVSINSNTGQWRCHSCQIGGTIIDWISFENGWSIAETIKKLSEENGMSSQEYRRTTAPEKKKPKEDRLGPVVAVYDYCDETGQILYQVRRHDPKTFRPQRPDGHGGWIENMQGVRRVLYHLLDVMFSDEVWIVEGEKDADNLKRLGFAATCNSGGCKQWMDAYAEFFEGKDVVICGDNDAPGLEFVDTVRNSLEGKVKSLRIVKVESPHKDISDVLAEISDDDLARFHMILMRDAVPQMVKGVDIPVFSIREVEPRYREHVKNLQTTTLNLSTWLPSLQNEVRSLVAGEVVMFIADTGVGKTALLSNLAIHAAPLTTLFFELELPETLLYERFCAARFDLRCSEVESRYEQAGDSLSVFTDHDFEKMDHIFVCPQSRLTVPMMERHIVRSQLKIEKKPQLVLIDYIQLVHGEGKSRYERTSMVAEELKSLAKQTGVILVVASQIARKREDGENEITLHEGKDSGSIENSSGLVIGAWRDNDSQDTLYLKILKNTKGRSGKKIECNFDGSRMRITERSKIDAADVPSHNGNGHYHHPEPEPELPQQEFEDYQATHPDP